MRFWKAATLFVLLACGGTAAAQEKDWSLTAGLKLWSTKWQAGLADFNPAAGADRVFEIDSERKLVPVGSAELRYKQLLVSGSYFKRTPYSFPTVTSGGHQFSTQIERSQYDVGVGWLVIPQLALTLGYKNVQFRFTQTTLDTGVGATTFYDAFALGLAVNAPLSRDFSVYGSFGGGPAKAKYSAGGSSEGSYTASEIGVGYALRRNLSATFGYRVEILSVNVGTQTNRDVLSGFLLGLNYTFF